MEILFSSISIKDRPTGVFNRAFILAKEMVVKGHNVTLLTISETFVFFFRTEVRDGVKIVSFTNLWGSKVGKFGYSVLGILIRFFYILPRKYDIVHSDMHRPLSSVPCILYRSIRRKTPYITDWQDLFGKTGIYDIKSRIWKNTVGPFDNWLEHYCVKKATGVVILSELLRREALALGRTNDDMMKLWGGSDVNKIHFYNSPKKNRLRFNIDQDAFVFVYAAMHKSDYESYRLFFQAFKNLKAKGENIVLVRTGSSFDLSFREVNKIGDEIFDVGFIEYTEYGDFLSCANCFILLQEPTKNVLAKWPNVLGDYLAAGRPTIANVVGEIELLKESYPISILPLTVSESIELYEKTILKTIDDCVRHNNSSKIRDIATINFSWESRAEKLFAFYKKSISLV